MKDILKTGVTLMLFTLVAGLVLGLVYVGVKGRIEKADREAKLRAIEYVLKDPLTGDYLVEESEIEKVVKKTGIESVVLEETSKGIVYGPVYEFKTKNGKIAFVLSGASPGFGGNVVTVACFLKEDGDFSLNSIRVIEYSQETPGLGAKIAEEDIQKRFFPVPSAGLKRGLKVDKDAGSPPGSPKELRKKGIIKTSDVMTGATITPRAVVTSINLMYEYLKKKFGEG